MKNAKKYSTVLAAIIIAFLSIYAVDPSSFLTTNNTVQTVTVTLQLQSGAQTSVTVTPASSIPTNLNGDPVVGLLIFGAYVPTGANAVVPNPTGGAVSVIWQMSGGICYGGAIDPYEVS